MPIVFAPLDFYEMCRRMLLASLTRTSAHLHCDWGDRRQWRLSNIHCCYRCTSQLNCVLIFGSFDQILDRTTTKYTVRVLSGHGVLLCCSTTYGMKTSRYTGFYRCDPLLKVLHTSCTMISVKGLLCTEIWACVFSIHVIKCFLSNLMYALLSEHLLIYWFLQTALHLECYIPISYWKADKFVLLRLWRRCCRFVGYAPAFIWGI